MCKEDKTVLIKKHRDNKGGHYHVILEDIDDKHVSVGLSTKRSKGKGSTNYTMDYSPLHDGKHSYMRRQGLVYPRKQYYDPQVGSMSSKDYSRASLYGERAKGKYIRDRDEKKKRRAKR